MSHGEDEPKGWTPERVESLRPHFERDLHRCGVQSPAPAADLVVTAVRNSITDKRGRWLLGPHSGARTEHKIRTRTGSYRIDRLIRDDKGTQWVVDYKTSEHEGASIEGLRGLYFPLHAGWRAW